MPNFKMFVACLVLLSYFCCRWYFGADWSDGIVKPTGSVNKQLFGLFEGSLVLAGFTMMSILHVKGAIEIWRIESWDEVLSFMAFPFTIYMAVKSDFIDRDLEKARNGI